MYKPTKCTPATPVISPSIFYMFRALEAHHQEVGCNNTVIMVQRMFTMWYMMRHQCVDTKR